MSSTQHKSSAPTITYHRAGSSRRAFLLGGLLALLATAGLGLAYGLDAIPGVADRDEAGIGVLPAGGDADGGDGGDGEVPVVVDADSEAASMAMVGDSITRGSADAIRFTLVGMGIDELTIDGETSRRIEEGDGTGSPLSGVRTLYGMLAEQVDPDVWVIALGTNDVGQYAEADEYRALVRSMVEMIPDDVPLVWVDVYRFDHLDATVVFNEVLREEVARHPDSVVVSWYDVASQPDQTVLRSDDIHPNPDGAAVFASLVAAGIAAVT